MGVERLPNVHKGEPTTGYDIKNLDGSMMRVESSSQDFTIRWRSDTFDPKDFFRKAQLLVDTLAGDPSIEPVKTGRGIVYKIKVENGVLLERSPFPPITTFSDGASLEDTHDKDEIEFDTDYGSFHLSHAHGSRLFSPRIVTRVDRPELFAGFVADNSHWRIDQVTLAEVLKEAAGKLKKPRITKPNPGVTQSTYIVGRLRTEPTPNP